jgi:hypothetical protein
MILHRGGRDSHGPRRLFSQVVHPLDGKVSYIVFTGLLTAQGAVLRLAAHATWGVAGGLSWAAGGRWRVG